MPANGNVGEWVMEAMQRFLDFRNPLTDSLLLQRSA